MISGTFLFYLLKNKYNKLCFLFFSIMQNFYVDHKWIFVMCKHCRQYKFTSQQSWSNKCKKLC